MTTIGSSVRDSLYRVMVDAAGMAVDESVNHTADELFLARLEEIAAQLIANPPLLRHQENCARRAGRRAGQIAAREGCASVSSAHFAEACADVRAIAHHTIRRVHGENWAVAQGNICRFFDMP